MIYSKTCEYAIRALLYFARYPKKETVTAKEAARFGGAPQAYVAKIFRGLERRKILSSRRGPLGGFSLRVPLEKLTLAEVIHAMDDPDKSPLTQCVMGLDACNDAHPCPLHEAWKPAKARLCELLERTTIADLAGVSGRFDSQRRTPSLSPRMRRLFASA